MKKKINLREMSVKEISAGQKETRGKWYLLLKCKQLGCRHWMKEIELSWFAMARSYPPMLVHIIQKTNARGKTYKGYGVWSWSYLSSLIFFHWIRSLNDRNWELSWFAIARSYPPPICLQDVFCTLSPKCSYDSVN